MVRARLRWEACSDLRNAGLSLRARPLAGTAEAVRDCDAEGVGEARHQAGGFFTTLVGESNQEVTYFLAWESLADRETKWSEFVTDPDWITARIKPKRTVQIVGNMVSQFLVPTAFSSVK